MSLPVMAYRQGHHLPFYDHCAKLSTDTLLAMGERYALEPEFTDSALVCFSVVANRYYERNLSEKEIEKSVWAMNKLGYLFKYNHFDFEKSYGFLVMALETSQKHGLKRYLPYIHQNLAAFYQLEKRRGNVEKNRLDMMDCYELAFNEATELNDYKAMTSIFINLVNFSSGDNYLKYVMPAFEKFDRIPKNQKVEMHDFAKALYEGTLCLHNDELESALQKFQLMGQCVNTPVKVMAARYQMMAVSKKMQASFMMGNVQGALMQLDSLLSLAQRYHARDVIVDTYWVYYQYNKDHQHESEANRYFQLYLENKDSLLTYDKLSDITELNFQTQLNRTGEQVRILSYKKRIQSYLLGGLIAFAVVIIVILIVLAYNYRQLRIKNRQLYEKHVAMIAEMKKKSELQKKYDEQQKAKYSSSKLGGDTKALLEQRITQVLENSEDIYDENFDIKELAELTGSNQAYVSQVINSKYGKSFPSLLSEYRVNEACRRLADLEHYGDYTIEAIAQSVGFKSRTSFVALFKKLTGLTPSAYQKMARED